MKKNVLFVINTLGMAGAEMALVELLKRMDPEKYNISLYVLMNQGELVNRIPEHVKLLNKNYCSSSVLAKEGKSHMYKTIGKAMIRRGTILRQIPSMTVSLTDMVRKRKIWPDKLLWRTLSDGADRFGEEYDLAVAFLEGGSAYYVADHVKARKKAAFIHIDYSKAGYTRQLDRDCYVKFDMVFPIADEVKEKFLEVYPDCKEKTAVFHNMIDQDAIRRKAEADGGFQDEYDGMRILTVGRLTYQKAYPVAIEAMSLIKKEGHKARWYVVGDGPERENLEKLIADAGLQDDFILLGAHDNPFPYYKQCDLYVHATRFEGKSIAIQEAQTLGCAVIASDSSGNREQIVDGEDGILCQLNAKAVKDAVVELLEQDEKREQFRKASLTKQISYDEDMKLLEQLL